MTTPKLADLAVQFEQDTREQLVALLEEAYWRGHAARELDPTEKEKEALLHVLAYARDVKPTDAYPDWEWIHLAKAIENYDVAACKTPTGKRAHGSYVEGGSEKGVLVCSFCKVPIDKKRTTHARNKS